MPYFGIGNRAFQIMGWIVIDAPTLDGITKDTSHSGFNTSCGRTNALIGHINQHWKKVTGFERINGL